MIIYLKNKRPQGFLDHWISLLVSLRFRWEGCHERDFRAAVNKVRGRLHQISGVQRVVAIAASHGLVLPKDPQAVDRLQLFIRGDQGRIQAERGCGDQSVCGILV